MGKEYNITDAEHKKILEMIDKGKSFLLLRGGELVINKAYIKAIEIDQDSVIEDRKQKQAREAAKRPKLPAPSEKAQKEKFARERKNFNAMREKLAKKGIVKSLK